MKRPSVLVGILCLALVGSAFPVHAQAAAAGTTWFVHGFSDTYGTGAFMDLSPPTDEADITTTGDTPTQTPLTIHLPVKDALPAAAAVTGTEAQAKVWMKGFQGAPAPQTKVTASILSNGDTLGTATVTHDIVCAGDPTAAACSIVEYDFTIPLTVKSLPAGAKLEMLIVAETAGCGCYSTGFYGRGVSPDHPWQFTLPMSLASAGSGAPTPLVKSENLTGTIVSLGKVFANSTSGRFLYHWNTTLSNVTVRATVAGNHTNGTVVLRIRDAANTTLVNQTFNRTGNVTSDKVRVKPGAWLIELNLTAYRGKVDVLIVPYVVAKPTNSTTVSATSASGSTTGSKGSPALGVPLVVACALGVALLRRRR